MKYIIVTGWWCPGEGADTRDQLLGDDSIRSADFHRLWYSAINRFTAPEKIVVIDSGSPVKPPLAERDPRLEYISFNHNAGHSTCSWRIRNFRHENDNLDRLAPDCGVPYPARS